jgi:hypothetical protein
MAAPADLPKAFGPFGAAASLDAWCCPLRAAQKTRHIDAAMMGRMMKADVSAPTTLPPRPLRRCAASRG